MSDWMLDLASGWICSEDGENLLIDEYEIDRTGLVVQARSGGRYFSVDTNADQVTVKEVLDNPTETE